MWLKVIILIPGLVSSNTGGVSPGGAGCLCVCVRITHVKQKNSVVDPTRKKVAADTGT